MIAFFDANALIYLLEGKAPFAKRVQAELAALEREHMGLQAAVSRLSWLECRVGPMKANDLATLSMFDAFFARPDLLWVELNRVVVELAAAIRVRRGLRTPNALQASAPVLPDYLMVEKGRLQQKFVPCYLHNLFGSCFASRPAARQVLVEVSQP